MQTFGNDYSFRFFVLPFFQKKSQNKNIVVIFPFGNDYFLLMMEIHEAKSPTHVNFRLRRDKKIF